ncbi:CRISPR-associated endonuclease Cas3'' [Paracidobacterium acidisoli]|uniref:CRISPR-associated endonuclease Cas3 n=1 Tax=Paracidobacterium acidisoli TaxID=2303751 RepID=A0A372IJC9_9BACT|nr:CRISPR-associated endonuclease Cas3'' [Paracidobacterium acidisoli]MBT9332982.1 CRISPR-associated endonuclease Cas3'' [Paracidobacterium acidisoli]
MIFYAHSRQNDPGKETWQELRLHLETVAAKAAEFAPEAWKPHARLAGLWHDAGKYQLRFQRYIAQNSEASNEPEAPSSAGRVQHAIVGAAHARRAGLHAAPIALAVQAHHGRLKTIGDLESAIENTGAALLRDALQDGLPADLMQTPVPPVPNQAEDKLYLALATRFLFSALVDADSLDTEEWDKGAKRDTAYAAIPDLASAVEAACLDRSRQALAHTGSALNRMRAEVLRQCLDAANLPPGPFTLTVPTGGGKTLSGLAFALRHAAAHGLDRVIFVAPYTSILEQTVKVFRETLGEQNVVEHHSSIDPDGETDRNRQACENWDAPVIVTTSVQLFETLYANDKRRCRKLHRIGRSVIFLDEVQTFPEHLLRPIHSALDLLTEHFNTSVVHSTATQPRLIMRAKSAPAPKQAIREIVPDYAQHFPVIANRFRMEVLGDVKTPVSLNQLAESVGEHSRVLAILHRRKEAEELARLLGPECLHLSARMCAEHRTEVLENVRDRLKNGEPCRLVATQLVEAGVDLDFPVVFRALAGLETLAQAAGRCNREMRLPQPGRFIVFRAPSKPPAKSLQRGLEEALDFFRKDLPDLCDPDLFPKYAKALMSGLGQDGNDSQKILPYESEINFPEVASRFRMIEDSGTPVVADYGDAWSRVRELRQARHGGEMREAFRRLQRYTVSLQPQEIARLQRLGVLEALLSGRDAIGTEKEGSSNEGTSWVLKQSVVGVYDLRFGFGWQGGERVEPEAYIVG